jgi:diadenosine tetraphosphatase ApaH/serine/threonine PP2A family protein phosphatase
MSPADTRRGAATSHGMTQLSLFDQAPSPASESPGPLPNPAPVESAQAAAPCRLPAGASLWAVSFVGDPRRLRERLAWAPARYHARFGRAHALGAVPLAELENYHAAGVEAIGDERLTGCCLYLLHAPDEPERTTEEAT